MSRTFSCEKQTAIVFKMHLQPRVYVPAWYWYLTVPLHVSVPKILVPRASSLVVMHALRIIDLKGGSISPTLVSYGSSLGLSEIQGEISTGDGTVFDPLIGPVPSAAEQVLVRAVDGLQFAGRDALFVLN
jgi:hypothetical protein